MDIEIKHLSKAMQAFYKQVVDEYLLEPHHHRLLALACEAWDRTQQARRAIKKYGLMYRDRWGQQKLSPLAGVERDSRLAFARLIREMGLETDDADEARVPRIARMKGCKIG